VPFEWETVGTNQANRAIVTFAARPWGGKLHVYARLANYAGPQFSTTLRLYADGALIGSDIIPLAPDGEYELTWSLPGSIQELRAVLDGADALPDDDQAFISIHTTRPIDIQLVSVQPDLILRALGAIPGVHATTIDPLTYNPAQSASTSLTIFDGFLPSTWPQGAMLLINPPTGSMLLTISEQTPRQIESDSLVQRGILLDGLSFGGVNFGSVRPLSPVPDWATTLLTSQAQALDDQGNIILAETPLVLRGQLDGREVAVWAFNLKQTNLPARLAFPLLMARTVRDLTASPPPASVVMGSSVALHPDPRADTVALIAPDGQRDLVARQAAAALDGFTTPGFYRIEEHNGTQILYTTTIGVNAGSPSESRIVPQPAPPIAGPERDPGSAGPLAQPLDLWPWFVMAGLVVLFFEWMYVLGIFERMAPTLLRR
jgi:hypothetical protein